MGFFQELSEGFQQGVKTALQDSLRNLLVGGVRGGLFAGFGSLIGEDPGRLFLSGLGSSIEEAEQRRREKASLKAHKEALAEQAKQQVLLSMFQDPRFTTATPTTPEGSVGPPAPVGRLSLPEGQELALFPSPLATKTVGDLFPNLSPGLAGISVIDAQRMGLLGELAKQQMERAQRQEVGAALKQVAIALTPDAASKLELVPDYAFTPDMYRLVLEDLRRLTPAEIEAKVRDLNKLGATGIQVTSEGGVQLQFPAPSKFGTAEAAVAISDAIKTLEEQKAAASLVGDMPLVQQIEKQIADLVNSQLELLKREGRFKPVDPKEARIIEAAKLNFLLTEEQIIERVQKGEIILGDINEARKRLGKPPLVVPKEGESKAPPVSVPSLLEKGKRYLGEVGEHRLKEGRLLGF